MNLAAGNFPCCADCRFVNQRGILEFLHPLHCSIKNIIFNKRTNLSEFAIHFTSSNYFPYFLIIPSFVSVFFAANNFIKTFFYGYWHRAIRPSYYDPILPNQKPAQSGLCLPNMRRCRSYGFKNPQRICLYRAGSFVYIQRAIDFDHD